MLSEDLVDRVAVQLIEEYVGSPYEFAEQNDDADHQRLLTIGFVHGVAMFAKALKEAPYKKEQ